RSDQFQALSGGGAEGRRPAPVNTDIRVELRVQVDKVIK
ncbi:MAG: hypothetical protein K0Q60_4450, partial [Microvirga sp.]|nr:hypothetical protein [Microvirga sp.]